MASAELPKRGREPLTPAKQKRLEKVLEHATKKAASDDFDYATESFAQCVLGEPGNFIYVRGYLENLQKKYNHNRKGHPLAQFKERGSQSALKKALGQEQWDEVIAHGLKVLAVNPWDVPALDAMATAAGKMGDYDCEAFYLKCALGQPEGSGGEQTLCHRPGRAGKVRPGDRVLASRRGGSAHRR